MQQVSLNRHKVIIIALIILAAVAIRCYNINGALFDFNPLRQAVGAAVARNYTQDPGAAFLLPQADNEGASPGYFMFELPMLPYVVSLLIRAFGAHNWVFRLPSIILFALSAIYFFKLCSTLVDFRTSAVALILYCVAPVSILMSRVIQIESFLLLSLFMSIYYLLRWFESEKISHLLVCTVALTVLVLLKITNLYIFLFIAVLFFIYKKVRLIPYFVLPTIFVLAVNFWWWGIYCPGIRAAFPTAYTYVGGEAFFGPKYLLKRFVELSFSREYWALIARQTFRIIFSPVISILFLAGVLVNRDKKLLAVLSAWLFAVFVFIFATPGASSQDYYKIHFLPAGVIFAAVGCLYIFDKLAHRWQKKTVMALLWFAVLANVIIIVFPIIKYKPVFEYQQVLGKRVQDLTQKDDLILTSFGPDAMLLYYCDRKGWSQYLPVKNDNIALLEQRRKEGAGYFVCGNLDELDSDPGFKEYLIRNYTLIDEGVRQNGEPEKGSLDRFVWTLSGKIDHPAAKGVRGKLERKSLGYVIFDLREKH
ncbi:MAG: glycosyltransferase family 39 protein [Candidatus Tantalella remota]|nr:glycosyltransferase family 39 protein [Candidatus Tantalella remota]